MEKMEKWRKCRAASFPLFSCFLILRILTLSSSLPMLKKCIREMDVSSECRANLIPDPQTRMLALDPVPWMGLHVGVEPNKPAWGEYQAFMGEYQASRVDRVVRKRMSE